MCEQPNKIWTYYSRHFLVFWDFFVFFLPQHRSHGAVFGPNLSFGMRPKTLLLISFTMSTVCSYCVKLTSLNGSCGQLEHWTYNSFANWAVRSENALTLHGINKWCIWMISWVLQLTCRKLQCARQRQTVMREERGGACQPKWPAGIKKRPRPVCALTTELETARQSFHGRHGDRQRQRHKDRWKKRKGKGALE